MLYVLKRLLLPYIFSGAGRRRLAYLTPFGAVQMCLNRTFAMTQVWRKECYGLRYEWSSMVRGGSSTDSGWLDGTVNSKCFLAWEMWCNSSSHLSKLGLSIDSLKSGWECPWREAMQFAILSTLDALSKKQWSLTKDSYLSCFKIYNLWPSFYCKDDLSSMFIRGCKGNVFLWKFKIVFQRFILKKSTAVIPVRQIDLIQSE